MKRTIKLRVQVDSPEEYAAVVHELTSHRSVIESTWTSHDDIKHILREKYGRPGRYERGAIDDIVPD